MSERNHSYAFSKLNLRTPYPDKGAYLLEALGSGAFYESTKHQWSFRDVSVVAEGPQLHGFLVKARDQKHVEQAPPGQAGMTPQDLSFIVEAKAHFFLDPSSGIVSHQIVGGITALEFVERFPAVLLRSPQHTLVEAFMVAIEEREEFLSAVGTLQKVTRFSVTLHPSNPNNSHLWRDLDEQIRKIKALTFREEYESSEGLDLEAAGGMIDRILMAEDGLGVACAEGERDGKRQVIRTGTNPVVQAVPASLEEPKGILDALMVRFQQIRDRYRDGKDGDG
ncbi:MAG TPA: hypothetical protein VGN26_12560 [Armatimonadota bacterium]|jgi:hypothetical protein